LEGFSPSSNWKSNYARALLPTRMEVADVKDPIMCPYCGPKNLKPYLAYTPFKDFNNGDFVLLRPHDPFLVLVWMGRTQCDVVKGEQTEFFKMVTVQWWVPMKRGSNLDEQHLCEDCKWKCNLTNPEQWLNISVVHFSFPIQKNRTKKSQISIPMSFVFQVKVNLEVVNAFSNLWMMLKT